ncbi:hypothetical protein CDCA_CDCA11G3223 [Cyanidium caldarium]|uniref:UDP-glucose 6-dehydrogenase n=1 Tax=Cyanidium caldarium TaxID=2771 RepID=A0AAV9IZH7_CYACA|nr:hypothetical protein CDCA_CDCA11G3223 [Cyanidium caldarium]
MLAFSFRCSWRGAGSRRNIPCRSPIDVPPDRIHRTRPLVTAAKRPNSLLIPNLYGHLDAAPSSPQPASAASIPSSSPSAALLRVAMIGSGYVGLVSGACFASFANCTVTCVDSDADKIAKLHAGQLPIFEAGLDAVVRDNVAAERLHFSTDLPSAVRNADVVFIAVGTPSRRGDGHADLSYVFRASEEIGRNLRAPGYTVIVNKSTVPVGTARRVRELVSMTAPPGAAFDVVSNPEFLRQGSAVHDFMIPERVVIGVRRARPATQTVPAGDGDTADTDRAVGVMRALYAPLERQRGVPVLVTSVEEAEMIKYAANAFLATKLAFVNEMADLCEAAHADVSMVARAMGLDARIGMQYLQAGPGFGGSCLPKDTRALARIAQELSRPSRLVETVIEGNEVRKRRVAQRIALAALDGDQDMIRVYGKRIGVLGLTFKAHTDDVRDSPAVFIVQELLELGARVYAYDPQARPEDVRAQLGDSIVLVSSVPEAARDADVLAVLTEWPEFVEACTQMGWRALRALMRRAALFDARNLWSLEEMQHSGFTYHSIGRPTVIPIAAPE